MTSSIPHAPDDKPKDPRETNPLVRQGWIQRRREKVVAEIERNRRGEYKVPTWVLGLALAVVVLAWAALIIFGG